MVVHREKKKSLRERLLEIEKDSKKNPYFAKEREKIKEDWRAEVKKQSKEKAEKNMLDMWDEFASMGDSDEEDVSEEISEGEIF